MSERCKGCNGVTEGELEWVTDFYCRCTQLAHYNYDNINFDFRL